MKKFFLILSFIFISSLISCSILHAEGRNLVVYYSWSGNTRHIAQRLAVLTKADLYEIRTLNKYPEDGYETSDIAKEQRKSGNLPEIINDLPNVADYECIYIGGPVWNFNISAPLAKFLKEVNLSGKIIMPFMTSQGMGEEEYMKDFADSITNGAMIRKHLNIKFPSSNKPDAFSDSELDEILSGWLNSKEL